MQSFAPLHEGQGMMRASGVDLQVSFTDCLEDAMHGTVTVVVQEHWHPAR